MRTLGLALAGLAALIVAFVTGVKNGSQAGAMPGKRLIRTEKSSMAPS